MIRRRHTAVVLMYHSVVTADRDPFWIRVAPEHFEAHLVELDQLARVVPLRAIFDDDDPTPRVAITFDDGYADNHEVARPMLERAHMPATVFVASEILTQGGLFWWDRLEWLVLDSPRADVIDVRIADDSARLDLTTPRARAEALERVHPRLRDLPPDEITSEIDHLADVLGTPDAAFEPARRMTSAQLRALASSPVIEIGAHTRHHPVLSSLPHQDQAAEIAGSREDLQRALGVPVTSFAYPFGSPDSLDDTSRALVAEAGFELACTTTSGRVKRGTDRHLVPRIKVNDSTGREFARRVKRALSTGRS